MVSQSSAANAIKTWVSLSLHELDVIGVQHSYTLANAVAVELVVIGRRAGYGHRDDLKHPEEVEDRTGGGNKKLRLSLM
ncbi:hypothetical protein ZWY2020_001207 [Hordeum vulgare]|nr:hypothetical protein ZWY2020_001207 [Hordeum vulgare]